MGVARAAFELVALGGQPALELRHHAMDRGQVLDRPGGQGAVEFGEFGPKDLVEEAPGGTNHESGAPLPMIAIGFESVASAQREKQPA